MMETHNIPAELSCEAKKTIALYEERDKYLNLTDKYRNVTFVLGPTGTGKTTFLQWILGERLLSIAGYHNNFIIVNDESEVNGKVIKPTTFPELLVDKETDEAYYDIPGYTSTPETSLDILNSFFLKKIIEHSYSFKFLIALDYIGMESDYKRRNLVPLIEPFLKFVKNIEKYKNSIALVVTKVPNEYILPEDQPHYRGNNTMSTIEKYLKTAKRDFILSSITSSDNRDFFSSASKLIDIFLTKKGTIFPKIFVLDRPFTSGLLSKMPKFNNAKQLIKEQIHDMKHTSKKNNKDFVFSIADNSKITLKDFTDNLLEKIWVDLTKITTKINTNINQVLQSFSTDMNTLVLRNSNFDLTKLENGYFYIHFCYNFFKSLDILLETRKDFPIEIQRRIEEVETPELLNLPKLFNHCDNLEFFNSLKNAKETKRPCDDIVEKVLPHIKLVLDERDKIMTLNFEKLQYNTADLTQKLATVFENHYFHKMESVRFRLAYKEITSYYRMIEALKELIKNPKPETDQFDVIISFLSNLDIEGDDYKEIVFSLSLNHLKTRFLCSFNSNYSPRCSFNNLFLTAIEITETKTVNLFFWYDYLKSLLDEIATYEFQDGKDEHFAVFRKLKFSDSDEGKAFENQILKVFIDEMKDDPIYKDFDESYVSKSHLDKLYQIFLYEKNNIDCSSTGKVVIKGNVLKASEIIRKMKKKCDKAIQRFSIDIFVTETFYFDVDLEFSGTIQELNIIAPKWVVIGERTLNLKGSPGTNGTNSETKGDLKAELGGQDGAALYFFGLAMTAENINNLTLLTNGGPSGYGAEGNVNLTGLMFNSPNAERDPSRFIRFINLESYPEPIFMRKPKLSFELGQKDNKKSDKNCMTYSIFFRISKKWCRSPKDDVNSLSLQDTSSEQPSQPLEIPEKIYDNLKTHFQKEAKKPYSVIELDLFLCTIDSKINITSTFRTEDVVNEYVALERNSNHLPNEEAINFYKALLEKSLRNAKNQDPNLLTCLYTAMLFTIDLLKPKNNNVFTSNVNDSNFDESLQDNSTFNPRLLYKYRANYESLLNDRFTEIRLLLVNQREELESLKSTTLIKIKKIYYKFKYSSYLFSYGSKMDKDFEPSPFQRDLILLEFYETISVVTKTLMFIADMAECILSIKCILAVPYKTIYESPTEFVSSELMNDDQYEAIRKKYIFDIIDPDKAIYNKSTLLTQTIKNSIAVILRDMKLRNSFAEEVAAWDIPRTLTDLNFHIQNVLNKIDLGKPVSSIVEKFSESILSINNIVTTIPTYFDLKDHGFSLTYCKKHSDLVQPSLNNSMKIVSDDIKGNLMAVQTNEEKKVLSHLFYPFGSMLLENSTKSSLKDSQKIEGMENFFKIFNITDTYISYEDFNSEGSNEPFYEWKNHEYSSEIIKLCNGEIAYFYSDIFLSDYSKELIKFSRIKLTLKSNIGGDPSKLTTIINNRYTFNVTHFGSSYFMVKKTPYMLQGKKVELVKNGDYYEIPNGSVSLSPYATWKLQILPINSSINYGLLQAYQDNFDLVLTGSGSYINENSKLPFLNLNETFDPLDKRSAIFIINKKKIAFKKATDSAREKRRRIFLNDRYPPSAVYSSGSKPTFFLTEIKNFVLQKIYSYFDFNKSINSEGYDGNFISPGKIANEKKSKTEVSSSNHYDLNSTILLTQYVTFSLLKDKNTMHDSKFLSPSAEQQMESNNLANHVLPLIDQAYLKYNEK